MQANIQKKYSPEQALLKIQAFCAYQERCHKEVKEKLYSWGLWTNEVQDIIAKLIEENFLNEERFAQAYCSGKFRIKNWGRIKIKLGLKQKGVSEYCIKQGFKEINEEEYLETIAHQINKKWSSLTTNNEYEKLAKTAHFLQSKGFESDLVWSQLQLLKKQ